MFETLDVPAAFRGQCHAHRAAVLGVGFPTHQTFALEVLNDLGDRGGRDLRLGREQTGAAGTGLQGGEDARALGRARPDRLRGAALQGALLFGIFNFGANLGLLYWGERVVPSGIAAVLYATVPLSTSFIAAAVGVEKLVTRKLIAAVVAIAGVGTIFAGEMRLDVPFDGLLAVFLAATAASLSSVLLKRAPAQPSVFATNSVGAAAGAIICLAASFVLGEDHALPSTVDGVWPVIYLTLAGFLGAYVILTWLVGHS